MRNYNVAESKKGRPLTLTSTLVCVPGMKLIAAVFNLNVNCSAFMAKVKRDFRQIMKAIIIGTTRLEC